MPFKESEYKYNQSVVKVFGHGDDKKIKVVSFKSVRTSGLDIDKPQERGVNDFKLEDNISRAKSVIFELAFCNPWDWFFTGTLDKSKYARDDLEKFHKDFTKWISNYNRLKGTDIKFLVIPELHADMQNWHFHGFLMNLPESHLHRFQLGDIMGKKIADRVKHGHAVFDWPAYHNKFGFCDLEPIQNAEAISKYITKYINKELGKSVTQVGAHMYYRSRGLNLAQTVKKGSLDIDAPWTFENDHCKVAWLPYSDQLLDLLCVDDAIKNVRYKNYNLEVDLL